MKISNLVKMLLSYFLMILYFFRYQNVYQDLLRQPLYGSFNMYLIDMSAGLLLIASGLLFTLENLTIARGIKIKFDFIKFVVYALPAIYLYAAKFNSNIFRLAKFMYKYLDEVTILAVFIIGLAIGKSIKTIEFPQENL